VLPALVMQKISLLSTATLASTLCCRKPPHHHLTSMYPDLRCRAALPACKFCGKQHPGKLCPKEVIPCPNIWCNITIARELLESHMKRCRAPMSKAMLEAAQARHHHHHHHHGDGGATDDSPHYHPYPVCNGYCLKRTKGLHERTSWMMMEPVGIHWKTPQKGKKKRQVKTVPGFPHAKESLGLDTPTFFHGFDPGSHALRDLTMHGPAPLPKRPSSRSSRAASRTSARAGSRSKTRPKSASSKRADLGVKKKPGAKSSRLQGCD